MIFTTEIFKLRKKKDVEVVTGLVISKELSTTSIGLPTENNLELTKDDRLVLTGVTEGDITKVIIMKESEATKTFGLTSYKYNVGPHNVNSAPWAKYLRVAFGITEDNFTMSTEDVVIDGVNCLLITKPTELTKVDEFLEEVKEEVIACTEESFEIVEEDPSGAGEFEEALELLA